MEVLVVTGVAEVSMEEVEVDAVEVVKLVARSAVVREA